MQMEFMSRTAEMDSPIVVLEPSQIVCQLGLCHFVWIFIITLAISSSLKLFCPNYAGPTQVCAGSWDWNSALGVIGGSQDLSGKFIKKKERIYLLLSSAKAVTLTGPTECA
jgi:hypothetical protein